MMLLHPETLLPVLSMARPRHVHARVISGELHLAEMTCLWVSLPHGDAACRRGHISNLLRT